jgi:hypothetical protein
MIKQLANSDITVRPFQTFKNWEIQSIDPYATNSFGESTYYVGKVTISEGISCSGIFYESGSPYYNPLTEPVNPNGEYKRIVYSVTDAMFYRNSTNSMQLFGVEHWDHDPYTGKSEVRVIHDRVVVGRIDTGCWGEKIRPGSVRIVDNSNLHEPYIVTDDRATNLILSGSQFPFTTQIRPIRNLESRSFWDSGSGQFWYGDVPVSFEEAVALKNVGHEVSYVPDANSWRYDESYARDYYQPDNERFGFSVSAWYKYIVAGSPMDSESFAESRTGHVQLFKYDSNSGVHRFVKKIISPFTQNGFAQEFGFDNSLLIQCEDFSFPFIDISGSCADSTLMDEFGYAVTVRDDTLAVGAPNGDHYVSCSPHSGFVYVYDKYKGGADNWGLISILEGSGSNSRFGESVSVDNDLLAVGAPGVNGNRGVVYLFRRKMYPNKLPEYDTCSTVPTASFWNYVKSEESLCERIVTEADVDVVGEATAPELLMGSGSSIASDYVWVLETVLSASVAAENDFFGSSLEVSDDRIIVGCRKMNGKGYASLFSASFDTSTGCPTASWSEYRLFRANNDTADLDPLSPFNAIETYLPYDGFGRRVSMNGDHVVVCSYFDKSFIPFVGSTDTKSIGAAYFYSFGANTCQTATGSIINFFDCSLRYKTFGDRTTVINNNFARDCSVRGTRAVVSALPDQYWYSASYNPAGSGSYEFERETFKSENSFDQLGTLGRVSMFDFDPETLAWNRVKMMKRSKETSVPNYAYGWSVCLSDFISGSKFLVAGAPVFNYATESQFSHFTGSYELMSAGFPSKYSGSLYVYDMDTLEDNPQVGNVFYKNGQIVLTNTSSNYAEILANTGSRGFDLTYQGAHTIYEHEYLVTINPGEFNYSTNPRSLVNYPILFDVNQDGKFDFIDIDLILRFLNKQKFYDVMDTDDDGFVHETSTLLDESWWNDDVLMTEAGDVILHETHGAVPNTGSALLNEDVYNYIQTKLIDTMLLDIDGNDQIDLRDGYLLFNYWSETMTSDIIEKYTDVDSTRRYYADFKSYISKYTGELNGFLADPNMQIYQASASYSGSNLWQTNPNNSAIEPFRSYLASSSYDSTGSYLSPYITTVGLYDNNQLVAVAKLGRPLKNLIDWPINIIVRFDT